jgi:hypothetical protein
VAQAESHLTSQAVLRAVGYVKLRNTSKMSAFETGLTKVQISLLRAVIGLQADFSLL